MSGTCLCCKSSIMPQVALNGKRRFGRGASPFSAPPCPKNQSRCSEIRRGWRHGLATRGGGMAAGVSGAMPRVSWIPHEAQVGIRIGQDGTESTGRNRGESMPFLKSAPAAASSTIQDIPSLPPPAPPPSAARSPPPPPSAALPSHPAPPSAALPSHPAPPSAALPSPRRPQRVISDVFSQFHDLFSSICSVHKIAKTSVPSPLRPAPCALRPASRAPLPAPRRHRIPPRHPAPLHRSL